MLLEQPQVELLGLGTRRSAQFVFQLIPEVTHDRRSGKRISTTSGTGIRWPGWSCAR